MEDFYKIAEDTRNERLYYEAIKKQGLDYKAKLEYSLFCAWCRAFKNSEFTEKNFKTYQIKEKKNINFYVKKRIAELYFGYSSTYDDKTSKWVFSKN